MTLLVLVAALAGAAGGAHAQVTAVALGGAHTCALVAGAVKCWGYNYYGDLGDGTTDGRLTPVNVSGLASGVTALTAGLDHTCALTSAGTVMCWGYNAFGQLGDGTTFDRHVPVPVPALKSIVAIAAGAYHTCALSSAGNVRCWGWNFSGQLGDGTTSSRSTPSHVAGLKKGVTAIAAGGNHTCALTSAGGLKCWGDNGDGEIGDGTTTDRLTPTFVLRRGVAGIAAGQYHTCAVTTVGSVKCWGRNDLGQLGDNTTVDRHSPALVYGLRSGVASVEAGSYHTCAVGEAGGIKCWGNNERGDLGDGTTIDRTVPGDVSGLAGGVTAFAAGQDHTCAVTASSGVKCWGWNVYGQVGNGTDSNQLAPADVNGL